MLLIIIPLPVIFDMLVGLVLAAVLVIIILAVARVPILLCSSALLVCPGLLELHVLRYLTSWRSARGSFLRLLIFMYFISEENRTEEDSPSAAACWENLLSKLLKRLMRKIRETVFVPKCT